MRPGLVLVGPSPAASARRRVFLPSGSCGLVTRETLDASRSDPRLADERVAVLFCLVADVNSLVVLRLAESAPIVVRREGSDERDTLHAVGDAAFVRLGDHIVRAPPDEKDEATARATTRALSSPSFPLAHPSPPRASLPAHAGVRRRFPLRLPIRPSAPRRGHAARGGERPPRQAPPGGSRTQFYPRARSRSPRRTTRGPLGRSLRVRARARRPHSGLAQAHRPRTSVPARGDSLPSPPRALLRRRATPRHEDRGEPRATPPQRRARRTRSRPNRTRYDRTRVPRGRRRGIAGNMFSRARRAREIRARAGSRPRARRRFRRREEVAFAREEVAFAREEVAVAREVVAVAREEVAVAREEVAVGLALARALVLALSGGFWGASETRREGTTRDARWRARAETERRKRGGQGRRRRRRRQL